MTRGPPGVECSAAEINNIDVLQIMRAAGWTKDYAHHMHNIRAVFTAARYEPERGKVATGILQSRDVAAQ
jgi:UDP-N-acetylmuramate-alanine ligase